MATTPRPGSMAEGDKKRNRHLAIGAIVLNIILFVFIFFVTDDEWNKGGSVGGVISVIALAVSTLAVIFNLRNQWNWLTAEVATWIWAIGIVVAFAAPRIF